MYFGLYVASLSLVLSCFISGAAMLQAPTDWILFGAVGLLGFGLTTEVRAMREHESLDERSAATPR